MPAGVDGAHFDAILAELERAAADLIARAEADPDRWTRARPGKWTAGQHAAHVVKTLAICADAFDERLRDVRSGTIEPRPRRGPLEWLWIALVVGRGFMPRGARTPRRFEPAAVTPPRAETLDRLRREVDRFRAFGRGLTPEQRDRFWVKSPFVARWHYALTEMVRVQAVHVRHHLKQIEEIRP